MSGVPLVTSVVLSLYGTNIIRYGIIRISVYAYKYKKLKSNLNSYKTNGNKYELTTASTQKSQSKTKNGHNEQHGL
jgi:hypothetical protein